MEELTDRQIIERLKEYSNDAVKSVANIVTDTTDMEQRIKSFIVKHIALLFAGTGTKIVKHHTDVYIDISLPMLARIIVTWQRTEKGKKIGFKTIKTIE